MPRLNTNIFFKFIWAHKFLTVVSSLLCTVLIMFVLSFFVGLWIVIPTGTNSCFYLDSYDGVFTVCRHTTSLGSGDLRGGTHEPNKRRKYVRRNSTHEPLARYDFVDVQGGGLPNFDIGGQGSSGGIIGKTSSFWIVCAHWLLAIPLAFYPAWFFIRQRFKKRQGLCFNCGYDLRGSEGECPECGAKIDATESDVKSSEVSP